MNLAVNEEDSVALRVNQNALIRNLKFSFSNSFTVLTELLQNARRAGATAVHINWNEKKALLSVTDDGEGISDFQKLLTVAESGWSEDVIANDSPFGMGFLSCLFAADKVEVHSNGRFIEFATSDALDFNTTQVCNSNRSLGVGTIVELHGGGLPKQMKDFPKIRRLHNGSTTADFIEVLVAGFPLPVYFNGELVNREVAIDSPHFDFVDTAVGKIGIAGLKAGKYSASYVEAYLQGICVKYPSRESRRNDHWVVVHLDSTFYGRMPDRDKLVDEHESLKRIDMAVNGVWRSHLQSELSVMGEEAFCDKYLDAVKETFPELLATLSILPKDMLGKAARGDTLSLNFDCEGDPVKDYSAHVTRADIESGRVKVFMLESPDEGNLEAWRYVMETGSLIIGFSDFQKLGENHWAYAHIIDLNEAKAEVTVNAEGQSGYFGGSYAYGDVVLCDGYTIKLTAEDSPEALEVTISDDTLYIGGDNPRFLIPAGDQTGGCAVYQASDYRGEWDDFMEADRETDDDEFVQLVGVLRGTHTSAKLFHDRISTANIFVEELKGKTFITSFNGDRYSMVVDEVDSEFSAAVAEELSKSGCNISAEMVKSAIDACMKRS